MPLFVDQHTIEGATPEEVALAHLKDLEVQWKHGVKYLRYWIRGETGRINCLVRAPSAEAAIAAHTEAHGLIPERIIEADAVTVEELLGSADEMEAWMPGSRFPPPSESSFRVIMFTDIEGSTDLMQRFGDSKGMELLRTHNGTIRDSLRDHDGREVKHTGDGIMACFTSPSRALECSIEIQHRFDYFNRQREDSFLRIRVGLSAGEPVEESNDLFGATVILASRLCAHAQGEQILVTHGLKELAMGKNISFVDRGEAALKGFSEMMRLFEVDWRARSLA